jgi:hypothetical protein
MTANVHTAHARAAVEGLFDHWDDARAAELFAMNVELDEPVAARRATLERIRERHGALTPDDSEPTESESPYHLAWWMTGARGGRVRIEILLTPELPAKVQTFSVTSVPKPPAALQAAAERIVAALNPQVELGPITIDWPADVRVSVDVDLGSVVRAMRAAEARFAPVVLGAPTAGDSATKGTWRLNSPRGRSELSLELDPEIECIKAVAITPARLVPPDLA